MPTYSYACTECEHRFDTVQAFSDSSLTECPQCTGRLRKLFSSVGVVFKGSGFYRTDNRAGSSEGKNSGDSTTEKADKSDNAEKSSSTSESSGSSTGSAESKNGQKSESTRSESSSHSGSTSSAAS